MINWFVVLKRLCFHPSISVTFNLNSVLSGTQGLPFWEIQQRVRCKALEIQLAKSEQRQLWSINVRDMCCFNTIPAKLLVVGFIHNLVLYTNSHTSVRFRRASKILGNLLGYLLLTVNKIITELQVYLSFSKRLGYKTPR